MPSWRPLGGLLLAHGAALTANRFLLIALPWLVLTSTGSPAQTGMVAFCQIGPFVIVQALSGPLLDRINPARVSTFGDLISGAAIAVLALHGNPSPELLMTIAAVIGAADGPASAAKQLLLPAVIRTAGQPIERGTGLATAAERSATAIGPALAAVLITALGIHTALWSATLLFTGAAVAGTISGTGYRPLTSGRLGADPYLDRLRRGAVFLRGDMSLRAIVAMIVITNFLDQMFLAVLLPVWARHHGHGADAVGLAISAFAAAAAGTALLAAWIGNRLPRRTAYLVGFTVSGVSRLVVLACDAPPSTVLLVFAVAGLGSGLVNPLITAVTYERIPAHLLGRVNTLITALAFTGIPFGGIAGAALLTTAGLTPALWCCSAAYLAAVLRPGWRVRWQPPPLPEPVGPPVPPPQRPARVRT